MKSILIIEDETEINNMLTKLLQSNNYNVIQAFSGTEGILLQNKNIDLILLDLMLPGKTGEQIIKDLKRINNIPIIVISAIDDIDKKVDLFELGANDYITKPFNNKELLARIKVQLKNENNPSKIIIEYKDLILDTQNYKLKCNNQEVTLTKQEYLLLKTLMERPNQVITKSVLFDQVWQGEDSADENTLNVHISRIRNKLKEKNPNTEYIETIWSVGYRMKK